ncbi:SDR family oxidoreductase [Granulicella sp. S190]|uniref:SDR family oxidoreductase n=1 Tax=Granulicella sp. S190 TaxID=1747226 RepID=UPI00131B63CA|nr:SDR family oxidoreductase [Granulicella sp. S190]
MNTTGNTILITGGGSGIGRGLAEAFHKLGNHVIIAGRRKQLLDETVAANPGMSSAVLDIDNAASIRAFAAKLITDFPTLNAVIHSAGIMRFENLLAQPEDLVDAEAIVTTNLLGTIRLTAALLPHFQKQPHAAILTVTSILAFLPLAMAPTYNATKAAIHSYTESLRHQLKSTNIQVLEIIPPYVQTELTGSHQVSDPRAMPLADYLNETMQIFKTQPNATEILVERGKPMRFAQQNGPEKYAAFFIQFNDAMSSH